jgi:hypothetical protein
VTAAALSLRPKEPQAPALPQVAVQVIREFVLFSTQATTVVEALTARDAGGGV